MKEIINEPTPAREVLLRLDEGEELFDVLKKYAVDNRINGAKFSVIGACSSIKMTFYCPDDKSYDPTEADCKPLQENLEVVTLTGNIGWMDEKPIIHAHGEFSKKDFSTIGGHLFAVVTSATLEVMLTIYTGTINRAKHPKWNLHLMTTD